MQLADKAIGPKPEEMQREVKEADNVSLQNLQSAIQCEDSESHCLPR